MCGKKVSPKVICHFLSNYLIFYVKFYMFITCSYTHKKPNSIWLPSVTAKLQNFLCDHLVIFAHSNVCMKDDDVHFDYRRIVYFVVQITTNFMCHVTKYDASFVLQTFREHQKWLRGHPRNLITLSQLKIIQCYLGILCNYEWVISAWNFM